MSHPADRVSETLAASYFEQMRKLGNRDQTIVNYFHGLKRALKILAPGRDFRWLIAPGARSLDSYLPMRRRPIKLHHPAERYEWGRRLMDEALTLVNPLHRRLRYRDGLIITVFARRAPRLRSLASLCLGTNIIKTGGRYRISFRPEDIKTRKPIGYELPTDLTPYVDRYLAVERRELMQGQTHAWLWVSASGGRLPEATIKRGMYSRSMKKFGEPVHSHSFRHALTTAAITADPTKPAIPASVLGISRRVLEKHYNLGGCMEAAQALHREIERRRNLQRPGRRAKR